jgi:hypothetical protein
VAINPNAAGMMDEALRAAGIPIDGVSILNTTGTASGYPPEWHLVSRPDGLVVRIDYRPEATPPQVTQGDDIVRTLDVTLMRARPLWAIRADIAALSAAQWTNIWTDLYAAAPPVPRKYLADYGPNASAIYVFDWSLYVSGPTAAQQKAGQISLAALYTQDNPAYLKHPPFDSTINISGDEPVP